MRPHLLDFESGIPGLGRVVLPSYFFMLGVAFAVGFVLVRRESRRVGLDPERMTDLAVYIVIFSLIGSRAAHVLFDGLAGDYLRLCLSPELLPAEGLPDRTCVTDADCKIGTLSYVCSMATARCHPPRDCLAVFRGWQGGLTYYGGFLLAFLFAYVFVRRHRIRWGHVLDLFGFLIPLGLIFGRIGCYLNGCCFGALTDLPWGASFPEGSPASWQHFEAGLLPARNLPSLPVHPTQLYSALINLGIFLYVYLWVRTRKSFNGQVLVAFLGLYSLGRFVVEFLRADQRGGLGGLSTSQIISLMVALLAWVLYRRLKGGAVHVSEDNRT